MEEAEARYPHVRATVPPLTHSLTHLLTHAMRSDAISSGPTFEAGRTYHLECGEVLLPPDELLVLGSEGGHHVVEVHHNMYKRVKHREERTVATCE